jgi:hypothetical protein
MSRPSMLRLAITAALATILVGCGLDGSKGYAMEMEACSQMCWPRLVYLYNLGQCQCSDEWRRAGPDGGTNGR